MSGSDLQAFANFVHHDTRLYGDIERIGPGDADSLARLYDETSGTLYGLALRVLNSPEDAEEVVLDVYQRVWDSARTFDRTRGSVLGWLTAMTRNRAIDRLRSRNTRAFERPLDPAYELAGTGPAPESQSIFRQERMRIRKALGMLAPEQRQAIELAFFRGLSHSEVAETLGAPLGTIKTRIRAGMRKLRQSLAPMASLEGMADGG